MRGVAAAVLIFSASGRHRRTDPPLSIFLHLRRAVSRSVCERRQSW